MKIINYVSILALLSMGIITAHAAEDINTGKTAEQLAEQLAEKERCTVPGYAKVIGHEELWKKHNGCPSNEGAKNDE